MNTSGQGLIEGSREGINVELEEEKGDTVEPDLLRLRAMLQWR